MEKKYGLIRLHIILYLCVIVDGSYIDISVDFDSLSLVSEIKVFNNDDVYKLGLMFHNKLGNDIETNSIILFNKEYQNRVTHFYQIINQIDLDTYFSIIKIYTKSFGQEHNLHVLFDNLDGVINLSTGSDIWKIFPRIGILFYMKKLSFNEKLAFPCKDCKVVLECSAYPEQVILACNNVTLCQNNFPKRKISQYLDISSQTSSVPIELFKGIENGDYYFSSDENCKGERLVEQNNILDTNLIRDNDLIKFSFLGFDHYNAILIKNYLFQNENDKIIYTIQSFSHTTALYIEHGYFYTLYHYRWYHHVSIIEVLTGLTSISFVIYFLLKSKLGITKKYYISLNTQTHLPNYFTHLKRDVKIFGLSNLILSYVLFIRGIDPGFLSPLLYYYILQLSIVYMATLAYLFFGIYKLHYCSIHNMGRMYHLNITCAFCSVWLLWSKSCYNLSINVLLCVLILVMYIIITHSLFTLLCGKKRTKEYFTFRGTSIFVEILFLTQHIGLFSIFFVKWLHPLLLSVMTDNSNSLMVNMSIQVFIVSTFFSIVITSVNKTKTINSIK